MLGTSATRLIVVSLLLAACGAPATASSPSERLDTLPPVTSLEETPAMAPTTTTTRTPRAPIVLGFAGDTSFTHGLDGRDPLGDVVDLLSAPDLTIVNLETTIAEPDVGTPLDKTYIFKSPPASVGLLTGAGIDAVSLANNHTLDYRTEGLLRTIELLDDGSVAHFGAGADADAAYAPTVVRVGDWTIAFVGFTHIECGWVADDPTRWPEAAWACPGFEARTVQAVGEAASVADLVVVMVHWGIELDHCPQPYQHVLAEQWVDAGADLIIGSHPHVLQSIQRIGEVWVVHSTGNFAFPSARGPSSRTAFFTADVAEEGISLSVTPVSIVDGRPQRAAAAVGDELLSDLADWSPGWAVDADESVVADPTPGACDGS